MDKKREVLEALAYWVIDTVNNKALATPEEIAALPKVAQVFFENYSSDCQVSNSTIVPSVEINIPDGMQSIEVVKSIKKQLAEYVSKLPLEF